MVFHKKQHPIAKKNACIETESHAAGEAESGHGGERRSANGCFQCLAKCIHIRRTRSEQV